MDLDSFLVSLYVLVDDWWKKRHRSSPRKPGHPALLSNSEVLALAMLAQWPRWRSERDFWRFSNAHLREYFPHLVSQSQLNRRIRALEPELRALQRDLAKTLTAPSETYHVLDTTLIPAIVRVRACRRGLFAGQASFGRSVSKTEWIYGFKVALSVSPKGVVTAFGLTEANRDEDTGQIKQGSKAWTIFEACLGRDFHKQTGVSLESLVGKQFMGQVTQTRTGSRNKVEFGTIGPVPPEEVKATPKPDDDGVFADLPL